jgi:hypothetical protein
MTNPPSDDVRDDYILEQRISGKSARAISKELRCTVGEVDAALDRVLPKIDNAARLRYISLDLNRLDVLLKTFSKLAIEKEDTQAGLLCVKILERKAALLGLDSPQKLDIVQLQAQQAPSSYEQMRQTLLNFFDQQPPVQKALHARLEQLTPEQALELLGPLEPNSGNGAAGSSADDTESKH